MNEAHVAFRQDLPLLDVIKFCSELPRNRESDIVARQLIRSATSVAANYRAACRARSDQEMHAKLSIVEEEGDESQFWIEILVESGNAIPPERAQSLHREANEIVAMTVASKKTLKSRLAAANRQSTISHRQ